MYGSKSVASLPLGAQQLQLRLMRPFWKGVLLCWLLAALLGGVACGNTGQGEPGAPLGETPGASGDAGSAGASPSGSGGAQTQAGTADVAGQPVVLLDPLGSSVPEEPPPTPHAAFPCNNPQPFAQGGGYLVCEDKSMRIGERTACPSVLPREMPTLPLLFEECALDVDCRASANGFCAYGQCKYGCVTDDECGADQLCFCMADVGQCLNARCHSDADCPADYPCTGNTAFGFDGASFSCQTPIDTCETDYDCPGARMHCQVDLFDEVPHRKCIRDQVG